MPLGPVQLLVFGFERPDFSGEVLAESSACARAKSSASSTCWLFTKAPTGSSGACTIPTSPPRAPGPLSAR